MGKCVSFMTSPAVDEALEEATLALQARQPGASVSRSDTVRIAILSLAKSVQRVAPNPDVREAV
jgi:hypothetical protein